MVRGPVQYNSEQFCGEEKSGYGRTDTAVFQELEEEIDFIEFFETLPKGLDL